MTYDEMIAVIQAHKDGKQIQIHDGEWMDCNGPRFNFRQYDYRIKPEPREVVGWTHPDLFNGSVSGIYPKKGCEPQVKVRVTEVQE